MSDQEKKSSSGEIDWTLYGRQAQSIRESEAFTRAIQQSDGQSVPTSSSDVQPPLAGNAASGESALPIEDISEADAEEKVAPPEEDAPPENPVDGDEDKDTLEDWETDTLEAQPAPPSHRRPLVPPEPPQEEPPAPRPKKRRRARSVGVTFLVAVLYVVSVLAIAFFVATLGWRFACDLLALNKEDLSYTIQIESGESIQDVAQDLCDNGIIEYPFLFEVFAGITNKAENISSGSYDLDTTMDYSALLSNMSSSSSQRSTVTVTIPEGYTVEEIFDLLEQQGVCTVEELEESALNDEFEFSFLSSLERDDNPYWMEGYLFPDTYEFYKDSDPRVAIYKLLYNYSTKFTDEMKTRAERLGYSQHEIMIIASIIEKETDGEDQQDIASVIYNRLQPDNTETLGRLQMDSTIQYILDERKESLTEEDLQIDSPYNTYLYEGLPAGTICNPGMEAIEAALYPNSTTYYYFILGSDGSTHFFSSYSDFNNYRNGIEVESASEDEDVDPLTLDDEWEEQEDY